MTSCMTSSQATTFHVDRATEQDRPVLEQLWTMFGHEMSAYSRVLPDAAGRFRQDRLDAALSDHPGWCGYTFRVGPVPVGLAVVRGLTDPVRVISSFFLVHGARRAGHGMRAAQEIATAHPGSWTVAFQDANEAAVRFWRAVASRADDNWSIESRAVPERPDLPPDTWISFTCAG